MGWDTRSHSPGASMPHDDCPMYPSFAECRLRYNIPYSESDAGEVVHQTEADIPPLDNDDNEEVDALLDVINPAIEKHNRRYCFDADYGRDYYYHVAEQFRGDRMTEVSAHGRAEYTVEFILDLQEVLKGPLHLWRIVAESPAHDDSILIYPSCWRSSDSAPDEPLQVTLDRVNANRHWWERMLDRYTCIDRPGLKLTSPPRLCEAKIIYNGIPDIARPDWPVFCTAPIDEEPSTDEYLEFEKNLVPAIEKHGPVYYKYHLSDTTLKRRNMFRLVRGIWMQWDRTRILVKHGTREFTDELIGDIQAVLRNWPLWRVALDAEDERDVQFVYPDNVI